MIARRSIYPAVKIVPELPPVDHQIADYLTSLLGQARPRRVARMSESGELIYSPKEKKMVARGKYQDINGPLTRSMLQQHALGTVTYAITLDQQGKARAGVIEIDQGGRSALDAALRAAHQLGLVAYAFELLSADGIHSGGHVWVVYDGWYPVADIIAQLDQVILLAGLPANTELWPRDKANNRGSDQGIRAPFGYHRTKATRGALRLQTGEITLLDTELVNGVYQVLNLPTNAAPPPAILKPLQDAPADRSDKSDYTKLEKGGNISTFKQSPSHKVIRLTGQRMDTRSIFAEARAQFNADHDWSELLGEYGGTEVTTDYWACDCGVAHTHNIQIAITSQDKIISLSNRCDWASDDKALDKFGFWCDQAHAGNYHAAAEAAARQYGLWIEPQAPARPEPVDTQYRAPSQDAQRKRAARLAARQERIARIDPLIDQLDQDSAIYPFARDLFGYHLACWSSGPEHYASIERITRDVLNLDRAPTENEYRRVQLAHQRLIECHYLKRSIRGSSTVKETNCWQPGTMDGYRVIRDAERAEAHQEAKNEGRITLIESSKDLLLESLDLVSGAGGGHHENVYANTLDDWQWSADEHSADELSALEIPNGLDFAQPETVKFTDLPATLRHHYGRYQVSDGARFGGWSATEAGAWEKWGAPVEGARVLEVVDSDQWLVVDYRNYALISEHTSPTPAFAEAESLNVWAAALDQPAETLKLSTFDDGAEPEAASYTPVDLPPGPYTGRSKHALDNETRYKLVWEAMRRRDDADTPLPPGMLNLLTAGDQDADDPLVRCAPSDPKLAREYWQLKNKKATSAKQAIWMRRRVAELEVLMPLSERNEQPAPGGRWLDGRQPRPSQAPARRPGPALAQEAFYGIV